MIKLHTGLDEWYTDSVERSLRFQGGASWTVVAVPAQRQSE